MSRDKLGTLYFLFRKTYYQQTWQTRVDEVSSINSNDNFLMWCSDVMWQIKNDWSPLHHNLWPPNFQGSRFRVRGSWLPSESTAWLQDHEANKKFRWRFRFLFYKTLGLLNLVGTGRPIAQYDVTKVMQNIPQRLELQALVSYELQISSLLARRKCSKLDKSSFSWHS